MAVDKQIKPLADSVVTEVLPERLNFKSLVLGNPNYFGTSPKLGGTVIKVKSFNTAYEQLMCLGLNPQQSRLEAVPNIKQTSGYDTDACGTGSLEYVRFFVQKGSAWTDLGSTSIMTAQAIPAPLARKVPLRWTLQAWLLAAIRFRSRRMTGR